MKNEEKDEKFNFLSDEEHMTILQEKVIRFMCEYAKIEGSTK